MMRRLTVLTAILLAAAACGNASLAPSEIDPLEPITPSEIRLLLASADQPVLLNVWASWCTPCRAEAPLLRSAHDQFGDRVRFIGVDVEDSQDGARAFVAEFGLDGFQHFFDGSGAVPDALGGFGVPLTFFFAPGGELVRLHSGVIDEATLALQLDELLLLEG